MEYLFRAWNKNVNHLFYPTTDIEFEGVVDGERVCSDFNYQDLLDGDHHYLVPMLFSGVKDGNRELVYEKDIIGEPRVGMEPEVIGVVKFDTDMCAFVIEKTNGGWEYLAQHFMQHKNHEVIGNLFETPELTTTK